MDICAEVKRKKELQGLSDDYVKKKIDEIIKKNNFSSNLKEKDRKELIKLVRAELRLKVGRFNNLDQSDIDFSSQQDVQKILKKHSSTNERLHYYPEIIARIKNLNPGVIIDLGCGVNPLCLGNLSSRYEAYDLDSKSLEIVSKYFKSNNIQGQVHEEDITQVKQFPHNDLAILFKILDVIDKKGHKKAEELISKLNSRNLIISFSTKTLSGAPMNHPQRGWIERLLTRLGYGFELVKAKNEIFYFVSK